MCYSTTDSYLRALLLHRPSRLVVDARLVQRDVHAVTIVMAERRQIEDSPATVVRDVDAIILVIRHGARIHLDIACNTQKCKRHHFMALST